MPNQIYAGDTFVNGQQVDASRLNNHVGNAILRVGCITEQPENNTIVGTDVILSADVSANTLNKIKVEDLFTANVPAKVSTLQTENINATTGANGKLTINTAAKTFTPGGTYQASGNLITVTLDNHEINVGDVVTLYTTPTSSFDGDYTVITKTTNTFVCILNNNLVITTPVSGVVGYFIRAGTVTVDKNLSSDTFYGRSIAASTIKTGSVNVSGSVVINGSLSFNGSSGYILYQIYEETMATWQATIGGLNPAVWTSQTFTKPSNEIWILEISAFHRGYRGYSYEFAGRWGDTVLQTGNYLFIEKAFDSAGGGYPSHGWFSWNYIIPSGTAYTDKTVKIDAYASNGSQMALFPTLADGFSAISTGVANSPSKFRIYKYKTTN